MMIKQIAIPSLETKWLFLALFGFMLAANGVQADIYFWEDDNGIIYFSNQDAPPQAKLYAREITEDPQTVEANAEPHQQRLVAAEKRQKELQTQLDASLEKIEKLEQDVEAAQKRAHDLALATRQSIACAEPIDHEHDGRQPSVAKHIIYYVAPGIDKKPIHKKLKSHKHIRLTEYGKWHKKGAIPGKARDNKHKRFSTTHRKVKIHPNSNFQTHRPKHLKSDPPRKPWRYSRPRHSATYRGAGSLIGK